MESPNQPSDQAPIPEPTGFTPMPASSPAGMNDSGSGASAVLPAELQGFNVGAFLMNWIWAIAHSVWIGLLALIPCVGLAVAVYLGIKGNELAWQNRRWESVEQFKATQKVWMWWGIGIIIAAVLLQIVAGILGAAAGVQAGSQ